MARGEHGVMRIEVVYSPSARIVDAVELRLEEGSTVAQALRASGLEQRHPNIDMVASPVGVWGRLCAGSERSRAARSPGYRMARRGLASWFMGSLVSASRRCLIWNTRTSAAGKAPCPR